jgi:hypothetical protein
MPTVKPPLHEHICLICRGEYPCWGTDCVPRADIVCDECVEDKTEQEEIAQNTRTVC